MSKTYAVEIKLQIVVGVTTPALLNSLFESSRRNERSSRHIWGNTYRMTDIADVCKDMRCGAAFRQFGRSDLFCSGGSSGSWNHGQRPGRGGRGRQPGGEGRGRRPGERGPEGESSVVRDLVVRVLVVRIGGASVIVVDVVRPFFNTLSQCRGQIPNTVPLQCENLLLFFFRQPYYVSSHSTRRGGMCLGLQQKGEQIDQKT
mmetsp:Transcript_25800/g.53643  ORF Transcript_25800/g.53643 Transcript_25800/m.53643 type:complete len:202 (+) Transcript_25800:4103-4708(+)